MNGDRNVVIVQMDRGAAVVPAEVWVRLLERNQLLDAIAECRTWGEYRALKRSELDEEVLEAAGYDEFPHDEEPLEVDLRPDDGESPLDFGAALESATSDFFESATGLDVDEDDLDSCGYWMWVRHESVEKIRDLLIGAGYHVTTETF